MSRTKVVITIDESLMQRIDRLVAERRFSSRSSAFQLAVQAQFERLDRKRLASESAKLERKRERTVAEEGAAQDLEGWPGYGS